APGPRAGRRAGGAAADAGDRRGGLRRRRGQGARRL
ncbi:MAG: hypothetical protein AVDCRST_MAG18-1524, partial [uncultured Thermomicrobiales bacterium]